MFKPKTDHGTAANPHFSECSVLLKALAEHSDLGINCIETGSRAFNRDRNSFIMGRRRMMESVKDSGHYLCHRSFRYAL